MQLKDAKIIITGGSLGIGKCTAQLLVEHGAQVIITGRNEARLLQAAEETKAIPLVADVSLPEDIDKTYEFIDKTWGTLDVLINNAGIGAFPDITNLSWDEFYKIYGVNVFGAAMMGKKAAEIFIGKNKGHIINIGSSAATRGFARGSIYASSKFALRGLTESWKAELRPYNIRVMLVNPSEVSTAFANSERVEREEEAGKLTSHEIAHTIKSILEMDDRGFIPELNVWATNPW